MINYDSENVLCVIKNIILTIVTLQVTFKI